MSYLDDMFAGRTGNSEGGHDDEAPQAAAMPDKTAQRLGLLETFALLQERHAFRPGDLIAPKAGLEDYPDDPAILFLRYLNGKDPQDVQIIKGHVARVFASHIDCLVMVPDRHGHYSFRPTESACYRPLTQEEWAELERVQAVTVGGAE